jgi:hypothetical protein
MKMDKELTAKSNKNDILDAYNEALSKIKELQSQDRQIEKKRVDEKVVVQTASQTSIEKIVKGLADIKSSVVNSLDNLESKLIDEFKKLTNIQQAITIETKNLEDIHAIKINADSLTALLHAQKTKKEQFESEMKTKTEAFEIEITQKRQLWKKEQETLETIRKEEESKLKKDRQRELDDYNYNLQLTRKKDSDSYQENKVALEKELLVKKETFEKDFVQRETSIASKEVELNELRANVEKFPAELAKAISDTEKQFKEKLEITYKHEAALSSKEIEGERNLNKQTVTSMENKIKEQELLIKQLMQKVDDAAKQVREIAVKAIEGASTYRDHAVSQNQNRPV